MTKAKRAEVRLGRMELEIMKVVWARGTAIVHDVKESLGRGRKPAYSTVLTMMRNLEEKGYLEHEVQDRTYVYRPTITRQHASHSMLGDLLDRVFDGSPESLVNSLIELNRVSEEELASIRKLLAEGGKGNE